MTDSRLDIVFWNSSLSPYMVDRCQALADRGNVAFEAWSVSAKSPVRKWDLQEHEFPHVVLPNLQMGSTSLGFPFPDLRRTKPRIVMTYYGQAPLSLAPLISLRKDTRLFYYSEKTFPGMYQRRWYKEAAKHVMFRCADGFLTPGHDADGWLARYGVDSARIHRLPHVLQVDHFATAIAGRGGERAAADRKALGLGDFVFICVGRLAPRKGIDVLLDAFSTVRERHPSCSLLLVGDPPGAAFGDTEAVDWIEDHARGRPGVVIRGFTQQDGLPSLLALADVFVFPTRFDPYGIVVDEALAAGLPVISSSEVGELAGRVDEGATGYVFPPSDVSRLAELMARFIESPEGLARMAAAAAERMRGRTPDLWAQSIEALVEAVRSSDSRPNRLWSSPKRLLSRSSRRL